MYLLIWRLSKFALLLYPIMNSLVLNKSLILFTVNATYIVLGIISRVANSIEKSSNSLVISNSINTVLFSFINALYQSAFSSLAKMN